MFVLRKIMDSNAATSNDLGVRLLVFQGSQATLVANVGISHHLGPFQYRNPGQCRPGVQMRGRRNPLQLSMRGCMLVRLPWLVIDRKMIVAIDRPDSPHSTTAT
jgi:hypothetical protein